MKYYYSFNETDRLTVSLKRARKHISTMNRLAHAGMNGQSDDACHDIFMSSDMYTDLDLTIEIEMLEQLVADRK